MAWHFGSKKAIPKEVQKNFITFDTRPSWSSMTHIEAYPPYHIDAFRAPDSPKFILLDETEFL
jgi:hypothetical protein